MSSDSSTPQPACPAPSPTPPRELGLLTLLGTILLLPFCLFAAATVARSRSEREIRAQF